jgi:GxxExxY protein
LNRLSRLIIGCAFAVANGLGQGSLEKVYENALAFELRDRGLSADQQKAIVVKYRDAVVGDYTADLIVENCVIVELKATKAIDPAHAAQCRNYLKATGIRLCLPINFGGPRVEVRRIVQNL